MEWTVSKDNEVLFHAHKEPQLTAVRDTVEICLLNGKECMTFTLKAINTDDNWLGIERGLQLKVYP